MEIWELFGKQRVEMLLIDAIHPGNTLGPDLLMFWPLLLSLEIILISSTSTLYWCLFDLFDVHIPIIQPLGQWSFYVPEELIRTWVNAEDHMHYMCSGYPSFEEHRPWTQIKAFRGPQRLLGFLMERGLLRFSAKQQNMLEYADVWR